MDKGKYYLAGPMRGLPQFNFPAFFAAAKYLREQGYTIISPAELDTEAGFDANVDEWTDQNAKEALLRDMNAITTCRGIILLPGWERSRGCWQEIMTAKYLNLEVRLFGTMLSLDDLRYEIPVTYSELLKLLN